MITTCLVLACKFVERDDNVPLISDILKVMLHSIFQKRGYRSVTYEQVCSNELHLMASLEWDLYQPTALDFFINFCNQGLCFTSDVILHSQGKDEEQDILESYRSSKTPTTTTRQVIRQPTSKTFQKVKKTSQSLLMKALDRAELFSGHLPEHIAIAAVI